MKVYIYKSLFILFLFFLLSSQHAFAKNSFFIGTREIFYQEMENTVDVNKVSPLFFEYFSESLKNISKIHLAYFSKKTYEDYLNEIKTGEKAKNIQNIEIGSIKGYVHSFSKKQFNKSSLDQRESYIKFVSDNYEFISDEYLDRTSRWTTITKHIVENVPVYSVSSIGWVYIYDRIVQVFASSSYTDISKRNEQLKWSIDACNNTMQMLIESND